MACYNPKNRHEREESERFKSFTYDELTKRGYVGRRDGAALEDAYEFLRTLEHRIQLYRLRRTHLMPEDHRNAEADGHPDDARLVAGPVQVGEPLARDAQHRGPRTGVSSGPRAGASVLSSA